MRNKFLIIGLILAAVITILLIVKKNYSLSPEYNYITAKLDIKNSNCRFVNVMDSIIPLKEKEIKKVSSKYGFKNVYLKKATQNEMKGIRNYNETIEIYLNFRNGSDWRDNYQKEIDSLYGKDLTN